MGPCIPGDRNWNGTEYNCIVCYNTTIRNYVYTKCREKSVTTVTPSVPTETFDAWVVLLSVFGCITLLNLVLIGYVLYGRKKLKHIRNEIMLSAGDDVTTEELLPDNLERNVSSTSNHNDNKRLKTRHHSLLRNNRPSSLRSVVSFSLPRQNAAASVAFHSSGSSTLNRRSDSDYESAASIQQNVNYSDSGISSIHGLSGGSPGSRLNILNMPSQFMKRIEYSGGSFTFTYFDVKVDFPTGALKINDGANIFGSIHSDIPLLRKKFKLKDEDIIVAPIPELHTDGISTFSDYVSLLIPHCLEQNSNIIKVQWFEQNVSDPRGLILQDVRKLVSFDNRSENMDIFYVDQKDGYIRVYTKHFSGILCTACQREVKFDMQATLFSKFGEMDRQTSLSLKMIVGGPLMRLKGFWKETVARNENIGFSVMVTGEIDLLREQNDTSVLQFKLELSGDSFQKWQHIKRQGTDELIHHAIQIKQLPEMVKCGNEHEISSNIQWYLKPVNNEIYGGNVTLYIDITNVVHRTPDDVSDRRTTINAEIPVPCAQVDNPGQIVGNAGTPRHGHQVNTPTSMPAAIYLLLDRFDNGSFKKLVRFMGFPEKARNIHGSEEEKTDYWYETMIDIAENVGTEFFPDLLYSALQRMGDPVADEVQCIFQGTRHLPRASQGSLDLASVEQLQNGSLLQSS